MTNLFHSLPSMALLVFGGLLFVACDVQFHPSDRMDLDGDGFFAPAPGAVDGKYVCLLTYREVDGVDVLFVVEAGDPSKVIEGDPEDVCLGRSEVVRLKWHCALGSVA